MELSNEQIKQLARYEQELRTAYYGDVVLGMSNVEMQQLFDIYNASSGRHESNTGCGSCRLAVMKWLGRAYFGTPDKMRKDAAKEAVQTKEAPAATEPRHKFKVGDEVCNLHGQYQGEVTGYEFKDGRWLCQVSWMNAEWGGTNEFADDELKLKPKPRKLRKSVR